MYRRFCRSLKALLYSLCKPCFWRHARIPNAELQAVQQLLLLYYRQLAFEDHPLSLRDVSWDVSYSTGEDDILLNKISIIGMDTWLAVDIGCGEVCGSNIANLLVYHGYSGLLMDGDRLNVRMSRDFCLYCPQTCFNPPSVVHAFISAENVNDLLCAYGYTGEIDVLSIDIDSMDNWIWKVIDVISPRIVLIEYQDILGADVSWTIPYKPDFNAMDYEVKQQQMNYCGASLRALTRLAQQCGYRLVGCSRGGWNAFFLRQGLGEPILHAVSVESCLEHPWNVYGRRERFPLVKDMPWEEV